MDWRDLNAHGPAGTIRSSARHGEITEIQPGSAVDVQVRGILVPVNGTQPQLERLPVFRELRFGVEDTAAGLVSGAFKLVARGKTDDLYIMKRDVGYRFKASRHPGGRWFLQATRKVGGAGSQLSRSWTEPLPETDGRVEIARIIVPRTVAKQAPDAEHPSTSLVQLDDAHPAAVFRLWRVPAGIWLRTEPGLGVIGGVVLPESKSYAVIVTDWLDCLPQLPTHFRLAPEHADELQSGETAPARSLTFWGISHDRLVIMDLPSASLGADENSAAWRRWAAELPLSMAGEVAWNGNQLLRPDPPREVPGVQPMPERVEVDRARPYSRPYYCQ